jgi:hypothetical protein
MKTLKDIQHIDYILEGTDGHPHVFSELCVIYCDELVDLAIEWVEHFEKSSDKNMSMCIKMFCEFFNLKEVKDGKT